MTVSELYQYVDSANQPYIIGHNNPDGDCIGATTALALLFRKLGRDVPVLLIDVPDTYDFLPVDEFLSEEIPTHCDLMIALDSGDKDRFGYFNGVVDNATRLINIDHHDSNPNYGDKNYVLSDMSSTCELLYSMIDDMSLMDQDIAKCLYTGIVYDTGVFKHSNTTKSTHKVAGELIETGINFSEIIDHVFYYKSVKSLKVRKVAIERLELLEQDKVSFTYVNLSDMKALNAVKKNTEGIIQMITEIYGIKCSVFIYEIKEGIFKVSLRGKDDMNVCEVAQVFGGGGHIKASGCTVEASIEEVKEKLLVEIRKQL